MGCQAVVEVRRQPERVDKKHAPYCHSGYVELLLEQLLVVEAVQVVVVADYHQQLL